MTSTQHHIVRQQVLDVTVTGSELDGFAVQRRLASLCEDGILPLLEGTLTRAAPTEEHWIIDRLEIDAGDFALEELDRHFVEAVTQAIEGRLREIAAAAGGGLGRTDPLTPMQRRTEAQSVHAAFVFFLESGVLPWWFRLPAGETLEAAVLASWHAVGLPSRSDPSLLGAMASAHARRRLTRQFSPAFLEALIKDLCPEGAEAVGRIVAEVERYPLAPETRRLLLEELWQAAYAGVGLGLGATAESMVAEWIGALPEGETEAAQPLIEGIVRLWPAAAARARVAREPRLPERAAAGRGDEPAAEIDLQEGVFVDCAGVVLLHPFLPRLFEALGIAAEDTLVRPDRALRLLHFLATGQRRAPEHELLLPKLLCNLPLEAPVDAPTAPTQAEEEEAIALLGAVIRHWDAIGDTTIDGLRGTFLSRPGKLFRRGNGDDVLQVETRSFDILLDRLPWGIAMIQLPWMDKILSVEWRF